MAQATVIADASALICLGWIDQLSILPGLFGRIVIPPDVAAEATQRGTELPNWVDVRPLGLAVDVRVAAARLDAGEREVLSLGLELPDALLILDDGAARDLAVELGTQNHGNCRRPRRSQARRLNSTGAPPARCPPRKTLPLGPEGLRSHPRGRGRGRP